MVGKNVFSKNGGIQTTTLKLGDKMIPEIDQNFDSETFPNQRAYHGVLLLELDCEVLELFEMLMQEPIPWVDHFDHGFGYIAEDQRIVGPNLSNKNLVILLFRLGDHFIPL